MIRRPPRSTQSRSSAASDVYKRQAEYMGKNFQPDNLKMLKMFDSCYAKQDKLGCSMFSKFSKGTIHLFRNIEPPVDRSKLYDIRKNIKVKQSSTPKPLRAVTLSKSRSKKARKAPPLPADLSPRVGSSFFRGVPRYKLERRDNKLRTNVEFLLYKPNYAAVEPGEKSFCFGSPKDATPQTKDDLNVSCFVGHARDIDVSDKLCTYKIRHLKRRIKDLHQDAESNGPHEDSIILSEKDSKIGGNVLPRLSASLKRDQIIQRDESLDQARRGSIIIDPIERKRVEVQNNLQRLQKKLEKELETQLLELEDQNPDKAHRPKLFPCVEFGKQTKRPPNILKKWYKHDSIDLINHDSARGRLKGDVDFRKQRGHDLSSLMKVSLGPEYDIDATIIDKVSPRHNHCFLDFKRTPRREVSSPRDDLTLSLLDYANIDLKPKRRVPALSLDRTTGREARILGNVKFLDSGFQFIFKYCIILRIVTCLLYTSPSPRDQA
eukprot:TRINITY_DN20026_c0_g1_i1.p1 TRINITY_DN20026_c0_g1~~TRINITY_DN20026_c0_g1_i1.p1  ORF type:complete len:491 (+),score=56.58 TRINITY_DN20026_c0_g1_i1:12-1484(+)